MGALLMILSIFTNESEAVIVRRYGKKQGDAGMFFNAIICFFAAIFFVITDKANLFLPRELIIYVILNCIFFAGGFYFMYVALAEGSFIGSKIISSASVIIPIVYGILFLNEAAKAVTYIAIALMFLSIYLQAYKKKGQEEKATSSKWFIYALLSAVCNGFITVIIRMQQIKFNSAYDNKFMAFSFLGAFLFLMIMTLIKEPDKIKTNFKQCFIYGMGAGTLNGVKNLINVLILLYFPISIGTPLKLVLAYIISFIISVIFYKEPITKHKLIGIITGVLSVILFTL